MKQLSNEQLLLLDNLIYLEPENRYFRDGISVESIVKRALADLDKGSSLAGGEMTNEEWRNILNIINNDSNLLSYKITNYLSDSTGQRNACFVDCVKNPTDVNVIFRGTASGYEWKDNGEGAYKADSDQQERAADYINGLPENYGNNITVSGHSKGGNKAQYVTIVTNRVGRCLSFNGQGFSKKFIDEYNDEISRKSKLITSINAEFDFVNCLLYSIAGTTIYIETESQKNKLHYHKPNIIFNNDGSLRNETEQYMLFILINKYTTYLTDKIEEPIISYLIDSIIYYIFSKSDDSGWVNGLFDFVVSGGLVFYKLDNFLLSYVSENYGIRLELVATIVAALLVPFVFLDDIIFGAISVYENILKVGEVIYKKLLKFGNEIVKFANQFREAIVDFVNSSQSWFNKNFNTGYKYAYNNPQIRLDTYKLRNYSDRLLIVNRRLSNIDRRIDALYKQVGLFDLWNLLRADYKISKSNIIDKSAVYLTETASDFEKIERDLISQLGG